MTLTIYTARVTYAGPYRLDITRKGNDPLGVAFAPSWAILAPVITARNVVHSALVREEDRAQARADAEAAWLAYVPQYAAEMRVSAGRASRLFGPLERAASNRGVLPRPDAWADVLARSQVVLVCFCTDAERCHRRLLAGFLVATGKARGLVVEDGGELEHDRICGAPGCGRPLFVCPSGLVCSEGHGW